MSRQRGRIQLLRRILSSRRTTAASGMCRIVQPLSQLVKYETVSSRKIGIPAIIPRCPKLSHMAGNLMYLRAVTVIGLMDLVAPKTLVSLGFLMVISCSRWPISKVGQERVQCPNGYQ